MPEQDKPQDFMKQVIEIERKTRDSIDFKRLYVHAANDDLIAGLLLSQIVYWFLPTRDGKAKVGIVREDEVWLAKKREDWWEECCIKPKQYDRAIKILENKGIVKTEIFKFYGSPTVHIALNWEKMAEIWGLKESDIPQKGNSPNGNMDIPQRGKTIFPKGEEPYNRTESTTESTAEIPPSPQGGNEVSNEAEDMPKLANSKPMPTPTDEPAPAAARLDELMNLYRAFHPRSKQGLDKKTVKAWQGVLDKEDPTVDEVSLMVAFIEAYRKNPKGPAKYCCRALERLLRNWSGQLIQAKEAVVSTEEVPCKEIVDLYREFQEQDRNHWRIPPPAYDHVKSELRRAWIELANKDMEWFRKIWERCSESKFLSRNDDQGPFFHLTWIFDEQKLCKLQEGRYDNK